MVHNTRSHNTDQPQTHGTANQRQTRKQGKSDPNEPPKRRKTRRSNNDSELDEAQANDEPKEPPKRRRTRRSKNTSELDEANDERRAAKANSKRGKRYAR